MTRTTNRKAVTLIELLIVVLILAALSAIAIPRISQSAQTAKQNACETNISVMNSSIEMYAADNDGSYPTDNADMQTKVTGNTTYFPDGAPVCSSTGTYSMDAGTKRVSCSVH